MRIGVVDNYDSFTFNLVHYLQSLDVEVVVYRNDKINWEQLALCDGIVLSPGPGLPETSGKLMQVIKKFEGKKPLLGVCLGHQALAIFYGAKLKNLENVHHGVSCNITPQPDLLFQHLPETFSVARYHSWVVDSDLPSELIVTSRDDENEIMSFKHEEKNCIGVQFHPESILTPNGLEMIQNWLNHYVA